MYNNIALSTEIQHHAGIDGRGMPLSSHAQSMQAGWTYMRSPNACWVDQYATPVNPTPMRDPSLVRGAGTSQAAPVKPAQHTHTDCITNQQAGPTSSIEHN